MPLGNAPDRVGDLVQAAVLQLVSSSAAVNEYRGDRPVLAVGESDDFRLAPGQAVDFIDDGEIAFAVVIDIADDDIGPICGDEFGECRAVPGSAGQRDAGFFSQAACDISHDVGFGVSEKRENGVRFSLHENSPLAGIKGSRKILYREKILPIPRSVKKYFIFLAARQIFASRRRAFPVAPPDARFRISRFVRRARALPEAS